MTQVEALNEPVSEPLTLFYHQDQSGKYANIALEMAARFYDLKVEKFNAPDYMISYFRLRDASSQGFHKDYLFESGRNFVKTLMSFKRDHLSEPQLTSKVNISQLKDALSKLSQI